MQRTLFFKEVRNYGEFTKPGNLLFGFGRVKTSNIPLLASCGEITFFPPGQFVSTEVVGIYSLCPTYWEGTSRELPLHHLEGPFIGTLFFKATTATVAMPSMINKKNSHSLFSNEADIFYLDVLIFPLK